MAMIPNEKLLDTRCTKCDFGYMRNTENNNEWFLKCDDCNHLLFCYEPMPHQLRFHLDDAKFKLYAGGSKVLCPR